MAIIYSYPLNDDIKPLDELVGTTEKTINGKLKTVTRNFLLQDLAEFFIVDGGLQKTITLTTSNSSGPATLDDITGVLNIPDYSEGIGDSPITIVNGSSLFSTGLSNTGLESTATKSVFLGTSAGQYTAADDSNFFGQGAGFNAINAYQSNFFGNGSGNSATSANNSNFLGIQAGYEATVAERSNFIGDRTGYGATSASNSNFLGTQAGWLATDANNSNLFGYQVGKSFGDNNIGSNNIIIGTNISLPNATDNSINLGGILFGTGTYSDSGLENPSITPTLGGKIGIGVVDPTNTLHIYSETEDTSGLRLERLTSASPTSTGQAIGVDANGNVVTVEGGGGSQDLQSVTDEGASTTNGITITVGDGDGNGIYSTSSQGYGIYGSSSENYGVYGNSTSTAGVYGTSDSGYGVQGYSVTGIAVRGSAITGYGIEAYSYSGRAISASCDNGIALYGVSEFIGASIYSNGIGLQVNGNGTIAIDVILGNSNKGLVINSGTSSTGNFIELTKNGVDKLTVNQQGELTATKLIKEGGIGLNVLLDDGNTVALSSIGGNTNLSTSQTSTNFTINSDTGNDAIVPLGNGLLAGATSNDYTTTEKNKLAAITGTNTGDQNLQQVTNLGANTTNSINIDTEDTYEIGLYAISSAVGIKGESRETYGVYGTSPTAGVYGNSYNGYGVEGYSESGVAVYGNSQDQIGVKGNSYSGTAMYATSDIGTGLFVSSEDIGAFIYSNGIGLEVNGNGTIAIEANLGNSNKGLVINSGTSSTGNFIELDKNGVDKLVVNQAGELTAQKLIKDGGTSSEILAADGSIITAGNNITITGGTISSVGGAGGGGSSVNYYLNGGTSQGTFGGTTYYEFSKTAVTGTGADFSRSSNGLIASFITDVADPSLLLIPAGNWNLEFFFHSSSNGGSPSFYVELYKYDGTTFTFIASNSTTPEVITGGASIDAYFTPLAVPETVLTVNDRLAIRVFVNASSKTITLHTQNGHLCEVITTFTAGLTALNGLQAQVQNFSVGTAGTDFDINSSGSTHTFNLPSASATARGVVTTGSQTFAGDKTFTGAISSSNLSNTNTGDETITTIKTKLGITTLSGSNTGDQDLSSYAPLASPTFTGTPLLPIGTIGTTQTPLTNSTKIATTQYVDAACAVVTASNGVTVSSQDTFGTNKIATVTAAQYAAFVTAGTVSATTLYFITA